jgi:hypothetical protein
VAEAGTAFLNAADVLAVTDADGRVTGSLRREDVVRLILGGAG